MQLAVCGLHMRGQKLDHQLLDLGATFNRSCRSSPTYELYAITDTKSGTCKPGMIAVGPAKGRPIQLDIWNIPVQNLGKFFLQIPAPLGLGTVSLEDGSNVNGFICEGYVAQLSSLADSNTLQVENITQYTSWKDYLQHSRSRS